MRPYSAHKPKRINWFANLRIAPLFAAVFLCAQLLATAHSAAYSDVDHVHDGTPCIIAAANKQCDDLDVAAKPQALERVSNVQSIAITLTAVDYSKTVSAGAIRGPPATFS